MLTLHVYELIILKHDYALPAVRIDSNPTIVFSLAWSVVLVAVSTLFFVDFLAFRTIKLFARAILHDKYPRKLIYYNQFVIKYDISLLKLLFLDLSLVQH